MINLMIIDNPDHTNILINNIEFFFFGITFNNIFLIVNNTNLAFLFINKSVLYFSSVTAV